MKSVLLFFFCLSFTAAQQIIDISVKGISDGQRDDKQKDRMEAVMDAKRQACEKAGIKIKSETRVENFKLAYDMVESKAEAVLLPGFQVIDVGYGEDGTYNVVLIGKLRLAPETMDEHSEFTLIINFYEKDEKITKPHHVFDRLYKWFSIAHGEILINGVPLEDLEDNLTEVLKSDTLHRDTRIYALTYRLPTGRFIYAQRTPNRGGGTTDHDFKLKLRSGLRYVMEVARPNAIYFKRPREFEGIIEESNNFRKFPDDFTVFYKEK